MNTSVAWGAAAALLNVSTVAMAQPTAPPQAARLAISAAVQLGPSSSIGESTADLTTGTGADLYPLFSAGGAIGAHVGAEVAVGYRVARALRLLVAGTVARPPVAVHIQGDAEGAPGLEFDGESLLQWTIGGRLEYDLDGLRFARGRGVPFLTGGVSALWQAHEGGTGVESGHVLDAGAGLKYIIRSAPASRMSSVAIVADIRVARVTGGVSWNGAARTVPAAGFGVTTAWGRVRKAS